MCDGRKMAFEMTIAYIFGLILVPARLLSSVYLPKGDNINKPDNGVFILLSSLVDLTISSLGLNHQRQYKFIKLSNW